ncbi:MAG: SDR family NAD(P)-dependent oxidoreductase [Candidatus Neomarinimicrobiota bacterium]
MTSGIKRVVLVTGASRGIGRACARHLADNNYIVYGASRNPGTDPDQKSPNNFYSIRMDVNDSESVRVGIRKIISEQGQIDVLINNAGIVVAGSLEQTTLDEAKLQFETNFFGMARVCQAVLRHMRDKHSGLIINISSIAGLIGLPYQGFYSSSKFAIEGYSEALSKEVHSFGIKVVIVEPGDHDTNQLDHRITIKDANTDPDYSTRFKSTMDAIYKDETSGDDPHRLAVRILKIIRSKRPRLRYVIGPKSNLLAVLVKKIIPGRWFEKIMISHYKS